MPDLFPFRGYRFRPDRSGPLEKVVTQPYDKISDSMRRDYLARSPFNVAHVIVNSDYAAAARSLNDWIRSGVLARDSEPSLYAYGQTFNFEGAVLERTGVIGLAPLDGPPGSVKGHEKTMTGPLEDRLMLMKATEANDGLIFSMYLDATGESDRLLGAVTGAEAEADLEDDYGVRHRLWRIRDVAVQEGLNEILRPLPFYIADGHHRFQTALHYMQECRTRGWRPLATESFDKRMMAVFNMDSPGLRILPTHRGVKNLRDFSLDDFLKAVADEFRVDRVPSLQSLRDSLRRSRRSIGLVSASSCYLLTARKWPLASLQGLHPLEADLDVNLLHQSILEPLLGIGARELAEQSHVEYYREADELTQEVESGRLQLGFLLNPTTLQQVRDCSEKGIMMPQKSTDFFPKLLTGLVFSKMEIDKGS